MLYELDGLLLESFAGVSRQLRKALAIGLEHLKLVEAQPLCDEFRREASESRVRDHPVDLRIELLREQAARRQLSRAGVRRAIPKKIGQLGGQFPTIQNLGFRARAGFDQEEELWCGKDHLQRVLDGLPE